MVDLYPSGPGMPAGHRWLDLSRWQMAWRVAVWSAFVGMLGVLLLGLIGFGGNGPNFFLTSASWRLGLLPSLIFGALTAVLGPWLRRFFPFTQGIVFGLLGAAAAGVVLAGFALLDETSRCMTAGFADGSCWGSLIFVPFVLMFAGLPLAMMAGAGLGIAILTANSRRARRICAGLFALVALVFGAVQLLLALGVIDPFSGVEQPVVVEGPNGPVQQRTMLGHDGEPLEPGMCADYDASGAPIIVPCGLP